MRERWRKWKQDVQMTDERVIAGEEGERLVSVGGFAWTGCGACCAGDFKDEYRDTCTGESGGCGCWTQELLRLSSLP